MLKEDLAGIDGIKDMYICDFVAYKFKPGVRADGEVEEIVLANASITNPSFRTDDYKGLDINAMAVLAIEDDDFREILSRNGLPEDKYFGDVLRGLMINSYFHKSSDKPIFNESIIGQSLYYDEAMGNPPAVEVGDLIPYEGGSYAYELLPKERIVLIVPESMYYKSAVKVLPDERLVASFGIETDNAEEVEQAIEDLFAEGKYEYYYSSDLTQSLVIMNTVTLILKVSMYGFTTLLTLVAVGISLLIIFSISPTGAIKKRYPTRTLYGLGIVGYLAVSIAVIVIGLQIDKPIRKISENRKLMKSWEEVSDYLVMGSIEIGEDGSTFAGDSRSMDQDIFDWYKSIYKNDGVYLVHTDYYDDELIEAWREYGAYKDVPTEALWMFTYSESYARKMGLKVDDEAYTRADSGVRLYLIPETWTTERKEAVKKWLIEFSTNSIHEGDIDTIFNKERQFEFIEYTPEKELFTWGLTQDVSKYCKDPVILICTPENSTFFINESLKASGLDGYIKMDPSVVETGILSDAYMAKYHLKDNHLNYLKVEKYMDGIRDDLAAAVGAFVAAFAILSVIVIGLMLCLASIFSLANRNRVLFLLIKGARYGILMILVLIVLEFIIFKKYMTGQELSHVISDFKEE